MSTIPVLQTEDIQEDRPMPSRNHSIVCQNIGGQLYGFRDKVSTHQQLSLNLNGWQSIPDICVYPLSEMPRDWIADEDECAVTPTLVIEVLSPTQNLQPLLDKVRDYLSHQVKACWVVIPAAHTIMVLPQSGASRSVIEGTVRDENLGIELNVADMFK